MCSLKDQLGDDPAGSPFCAVAFTAFTEAIAMKFQRISKWGVAKSGGEIKIFWSGYVIGILAGLAGSESWSMLISFVGVCLLSWTLKPRERG